MPTIHQIRVHDRRSGVTHEHRFTTPVVRIGREPTCELQLADPFVSAEHALLTADEHGAHLRDLGGTNGLRVAGQRLAPHATIPISGRVRVSVGPFDLEIVHTPDRDRRASQGAVESTGPAPQHLLHARLRTLRALHTPFVAARRAFESALADALHSADVATARRLLAEFPPEDHAHLLLPDLSQRPSPPDPPASDPQPSAPELDPNLSQRPPPPELTNPNLSQRPPPPELNPTKSAAPTPLAAAPRTTPAASLQLLASAARDLLPHARPPASLDEARRFLTRLVDTLRSFATGLGALQQLRRQQQAELGLGSTPDINPLLNITCADELLPALLAHDDRRAELLDCFAVLGAHAHAHAAAALATTRHLAAELSPPQVTRHAAPGLLRTRARWRSYLARYAACLGDERTPGSLRASFRAAYLDALHHDG